MFVLLLYFCFFEVKSGLIVDNVKVKWRKYFLGVMGSNGFEEEG